MQYKQVTCSVIEENRALALKSFASDEGNRELLLRTVDDVLRNRGIAGRTPTKHLEEERFQTL